MQSNGLRSPAEIVGPLRNHLRRAARDLGAYERANEGADRFGVFRLAPGESFDERELLEFLLRARREHPEQELQITVIAR